MANDPERKQEILLTSHQKSTERQLQDITNTGELVKIDKEDTQKKTWMGYKMDTIRPWNIDLPSTSQ